MNKDSTNSHKPPSSDSPFKRPPPNKEGEWKPGGQPGHKGVTRAVIPTEKVDQRVEVRPDLCVCGEELYGVPGVGKPNVRGRAGPAKRGDLAPHHPGYTHRRG